MWVQGSHEKNSSTLKCPSQNTRNISSETYMFLLGMTTKAGVHHIYYMLYHSVRSFSISQVDVHLEHLYPNPLRRLPSAILCEHHVQKPPAELLKNINEHFFQVATFAKVELLACYSQTHHIPYIPQKWVCVEPSQPSKCTSEKMI